MEAELTESSEIDSKTEIFAVTVEEDIDEDIPMYLYNNVRHKHIKRQ